MTTVRTLGELCTRIVDCEHKTAPITTGGNFFAVGTPAMAGNQIKYRAAREISEDTFEQWTRRLRPRRGDLLLAREAPVGPVVLIPAAENVAPGQRTVLLRPDSEVVDSRYLYYFLSSTEQQALLQVRAAGSTVAHLNVPDIRAFPVGLPELEQQRSTADVLEVLDEKIAANVRLAQIAKEIARLHFETEVASVVESTTTFRDLNTLGGGGTPRTSVAEYWSSADVPWATPTDVTALSGPYLECTARSISHAGLASCPSPLYPTGSILMTSRATIGAFAVAQRPVAVNQGFIVVQPHDERLRWWIFHEMQSRVDEFVAHANGATFLELSRGTFKNLSVRLTDEATMHTFNAKAEALHGVARSALKENAILAELRDTLLTELMSGRLRVREAEEQVGEVL